MAEMDTSSSGGGKHKGGKRAKKASTRVDLTAMVDLGFLLITFFMLTTTLNKPKVMELNMPDKDNDDKEEIMKVKESLTTTFVLAGGDSLYYWHGLPAAPGDVKLTNYATSKGMRDVILLRQGEIDRDRKAGVYTEKEGHIVLIKPMKDAKYKNMVDFLDEMAITDTPTYAIVDYEPADGDIVKKFYQK
jgi:biopolymer transport protein ExbD